MLEINSSRFVDFQKVRVQETQQELPRGSIPRRWVWLWVREVGVVMVCCAGGGCTKTTEVVLKVQSAN